MKHTALYRTNENALYEIAKQVTLEAGMPYTDPRTGKTTQPPKVKAKRKRRDHSRPRR